MNLVTTLRRGHLLKHTDLSGVGLEIGPYDQPTVFKSEADVRYLDWKDREQLVRECTHPDMIADIPEIDYVVHSNRYGEYISDKFDYVIANHVMEHAPNMIQWLSDLCDMMRPGAVLFLALPDKKFSFDKYRQDTALSHFVAEYVASVEDIPREHQIECEIYYDEAFVNKPMHVADKLDMNRIRHKLQAPPHVGIHSHVFESSTIVSKVLKPILMMGFFEFNLIDFVPARGETGGEMIIVLRKEPPRVELTTAEFYSAPVDAETAERLAEAETALAETRQKFVATQEQVATMQETAAVMQEKVVAMQGEIVAMQEQIASKDSTIRALESSTSWRITAPLRAAVTRLRGRGSKGRNISY
ncbi:methyltransferase family protein [Paraburkholderia sp. BL6665CI2N2]|uniref:methyltransferase domain-containing protein n=1 Tax=Paraburkholderia sp. BL6665CI2N2 TaxID=1938806 RepID=UPI0010646EBB|nr:methyltransferase domain-containing protein [Paraburkholderia sp. BL6665CI2N2]TDY25743.1 methyltransferase family protein [Paraburkholderia sp. BL6665CI2N2]